MTAELVCMSFAFRIHEAYCVTIPADRQKATEIVQEFRFVFGDEKIVKVGQNIKYDLSVLLNYGLEVKGPLFDTMIAHYLLQPDQTPFKLLDVIPASPSLGALAHALEAKHKIYKLRDALKLLEGKYDRVYIDTPPAFNFFTLSALIAADRVLIPFDCDVFSKRALQSLIENVIETQDDHNDQLEIEGIVVNQYQAQAKLPREVVQQLKDEGLPVLENMLPPSVLMKESHHQNLPLIHLAKDHKLTQAYLSLFNEIEQK